MTSSPVMAMLADGVPLSLLCDLVSRRDPESAVINLAERPPGDVLLAEAARSAHDLHAIARRFASRRTSARLGGERMALCR